MRFTRFSIDDREERQARVLHNLNQIARAVEIMEVNLLDALETATDQIVGLLADEIEERKSSA